MKVKNFFTQKVSFLFFVAYLIIGIACFSDYGSGPDEGMERQTALVNYRYIIDTFSIPMDEKTADFLDEWPYLKDYRDRYYGVALHLPLVAIENFWHFELDTAVFYGMRHFYVFISFYGAMICFYFLLKQRFGRRSLALLGIVLTLTTPRIFAESFYNNKDLLFYAWSIFSLSSALRWLRTRRFRDALLTAVVFALTCNTRLNGIAYLLVLMGIVLIDGLRNKGFLRQIFASAIVLLLSFCGFFYAFTPNLWEAPWQTLLETLRFNAAHPNHNAGGNLFFGQLVDTTQTPLFIPIWMMLTIPTIILIFAGIGMTHILIQLFRTRLFLYSSNAERTDLFLLSATLLPVIAVILMRVTIYNSWRHVYFAYIGLIYLALLAIQSAMRRRKLIRWLSVIALSACISANSLWIALNHPYQYVYFVPLARPYASLFSGDYWGIAVRDLLGYVYANAEFGATLDHSYALTGSINRSWIPNEIRNHIRLVYDPDYADYLLFSRDEKLPAVTDFFDREKEFAIIIDGDEIGAVYH